MSSFPQKGQSLNDFVNGYMSHLKAALEGIDLEIFGNIETTITDAIKRNSTVFACGNGGSASIAEHLTCDFSKGIGTDTEYRPKMWSLSSNFALVSATANDVSYEHVFSKQLDMFAEENDVLIVISSSGNSENILKALDTAKRLEMRTIGIFGFSGGRAASMCDHHLHIKCDNYGVVEDASQIIMHMLAQRIRLGGIPEGKLHEVTF